MPVSMPTMKQMARSGRAIAAVAAMALALPGASYGASDGESAVAFDNSCAAGVQSDLQSAIARLHSFEAGADTFRAIAEKDKGCAIAWWGAAMAARGNPL